MILMKLRKNSWRTRFLAVAVSPEEQESSTTAADQNCPWSLLSADYTWVIENIRVYKWDPCFTMLQISTRVCCPPIVKKHWWRSVGRPEESKDNSGRECLLCLFLSCILLTVAIFSIYGIKQTTHKCDEQIIFWRGNGQSLDQLKNCL